MKILILCTGNSCRSQMAQAILQALDALLEVASAGTHPAERVHPKAVQVISELGLSLKKHQPHAVEEYLHDSWDYVITVCGGAHENCPTFIGHVKQRLHIGFEDPAEAQGADADVLRVFRHVRDEILRDFFTFYQVHLRPHL